MPINYATLQASAKRSLQNYNAFPVIVRLATTNTAIATIGVFLNFSILNSAAKNIDNRQNPTWITGEVNRVVVVPGIDFVGVISPGSVTTPQVEGTVEWSLNGTAYKKLITTVQKEEPIPGFPILYTLGIE